MSTSTLHPIPILLITFSELISGFVGELEIFNQSQQLQYIYYFHVIGTTIVNIVGIVLSLIAFFYPYLHRESPVYTQILQVRVKIALLCYSIHSQEVNKYIY